MPGDDLIRLRHMLDASREAVASAAGHSRADLDRDRVWALDVLSAEERLS